MVEFEKKIAKKNNKKQTKDNFLDEFVGRRFVVDHRSLSIANRSSFVLAFELTIQSGSIENFFHRLIVTTSSFGQVHSSRQQDCARESIVRHEKVKHVYGFILFSVVSNKQTNFSIRILREEKKTCYCNNKQKNIKRNILPLKESQNY